MVAINVLLNQWNNRFYNALQEKNWDTLRLRDRLSSAVLATIYVALAVYQLYLNQWLQIRWRRWMTSPLSRRLAARCQSLPDAASGRRRRQSRPAHHRRRQAVRRSTLNIGVGLLSSIVTLRLFRRHPVGSVGDAPLHLFGNAIRIPGYLVWGALIYAVFGTVLTHWIGWPLVASRFPAAALRSRLPLQPGAGARELRADRTVARRDRRARAAVARASAASSTTGSPS